ncbi:MAG TPA: hypothetical protein VFB04_06300 [Terriglobales bacterium]|nr:hypothetical protein [Terriglobales bacterium]
MAEPNENSPIEEVGWWRKKIRVMAQWVCTLWQKVKSADDGLHEYLYRRWPTPVRTGSWLLHGLYDLITTPIFAILLAFCLVNLVLSTVTSIIAAFSAYGAWITAVLWLAKARWIGTLRIGRRLLIIFVSAIPLFFLAKADIAWTIRSVTRHEQQAKTEGAPTLVPSYNASIDGIIVGQLRQMFDEEIGQVLGQKSPTKGARHTFPPTPKGEAPGEMPLSGQAVTTAPQLSNKEIISELITSLARYEKLFTEIEDSHQRLPYQSDVAFQRNMANPSLTAADRQQLIALHAAEQTLFAQQYTNFTKGFVPSVTNLQSECLKRLLPNDDDKKWEQEFANLPKKEKIDDGWVGNAAGYLDRLLIRMKAYAGQ